MVHRNLFAKNDQRNEEKQQKMPHDSLSQQRPGQSSYTTYDTIDYLKDNDIGSLPHCPYSPDFSPNDFFLLCQKKCAQQFLSPQVTDDAF